MTELANAFTPSTGNVFFLIGVSGIAGFLVGFILKAGLLTKYKKRTLILENEMLANHSRILELEKQVTEFKEQQARLKDGLSAPKVELKVS